MQLVDRYIHAVTLHLPQGQRDEVARELHATIEDMIADTNGGKKTTDSHVKAILTELGDPALLAAKYSQSPQHLIAPKWFATYKTLLARLLTYIPAIVAIVMIAINLATKDTAIASRIVEGIGAGIAAAIQICFWTTLTFVILERSGANPQEALGKAAWTPDNLPSLPKKRQISRTESISTMIFGVIALVVFALAPTVSGGWTGVSMPILDPELWNLWIPIFLGIGIAGLVIEVFKYRIGNWTPKIVIANTFVNIATAVAFTVLATSRSILNPEFVGYISTKMDNITDVLNWSVDITIAIIVISSIWGIIDSIRKAYALRSKTTV